MAGPIDAPDALQWIREAILAARYYPTTHFTQRLRLRRFSIFDAKKIITSATSCEPYADGTPTAGGTCWRITGVALDESLAKIGVEAFRDHLGRSALLITIMDA